MHYDLCICSTWRAHGHARGHEMLVDGGRGRGLLPVAGRGRGHGHKKVVSAGITPTAIFISRCMMRANGDDNGATSWRRQCTWRTGRMTARAHRPDDGAGRGGEIARGREIARGGDLAGDLAAIDDVATGASTGRQTVDEPLLLLLHYTTRKK